MRLGTTVGGRLGHTCNTTSHDPRLPTSRYPPAAAEDGSGGRDGVSGRRHLDRRVACVWVCVWIEGQAAAAAGTQSTAAARSDPGRRHPRAHMARPPPHAYSPLRIERDEGERLISLERLSSGDTCSYSFPRLWPDQRRPTAADDSGSYSGHGRRIMSERPGERSSDQSRATSCDSRPREENDASERRESPNGVLLRDEIRLVRPALCEVHCGIRCSQTGIRSFQVGRASIGSGAPPRRAG